MSYTTNNSYHSTRNSYASAAANNSDVYLTNGEAKGTRKTACRGTCYTMGQCTCSY